MGRKTTQENLDKYHACTVLLCLDTFHLPHMLLKLGVLFCLELSCWQILTVLIV